MQAGFLVEILPGEAQVVFKNLRCINEIFDGQVRTESMTILPSPHGNIIPVYDHSWSVEVAGMNVIHLNRAAGVAFCDHANRNIAQPDGFLPHQPIIRLWRGCIVAVFADQLSVGVAKEEKLRTQWTILDDALILDGASLLGYLLC